jgi:hypothetical protein
MPDSSIVTDESWPFLPVLVARARDSMSFDELQLMFCLYFRVMLSFSSIGCQFFIKLSIVSWVIL